VDAELEVGRFKGFSRLVEAVFIPEGGGYRRVEVEPTRKEWVDFRRGRAIVRVVYRLPKGSVIVVKDVAPGSARARAFVVGEGGALEEVPVRSERVAVSAVGGREVFRYDTVVEAPLGEVRVEGARLYASGVGRVSEEDVRRLEEEASYALVFIYDTFRNVENVPVRLHFLGSLEQVEGGYALFREGRRLTPEEESELTRLGFRRTGRDHWVLDLRDFRVDLDSALEWLRANAKGLDEQFEASARELWERLRPLRELKRELSGVLGAPVEQVALGARHAPRAGYGGDHSLWVKLAYVDRAKFDEIRSRYPYVDGWFHLNACEEPFHSILLRHFPDEASAEVLGRACRRYRAQVEWFARIRELFRRRYRVEPTDIEHRGEYYAVRFPYLGREKFKEIASAYTYSSGAFNVGKQRLVEEMRREGLLEGVDLELLKSLGLV